MPALQITPLPTAPSRADPTNFAARGDALLGALAQFVTETNALSTDVVAKSATATAAAAAADQSKLDAATQTAAAIATAQAYANAAATGSDAVKWVSGTDYADGVVVWSPNNSKSYRKVGAGVSTTDPALDTSGAWTVPLFIPGTGPNIASPAANTAIVLGPSSPMLQTLTPQGIGVSVQMPPATAMQAAIAAAYVSNKSASYQVGVRDGAGTLRLVMPASTAVQFMLTDNSTAAGKYEYPAATTDDGLLRVFEAYVAGWNWKTHGPNVPASSVEYLRHLLFLSNTLAVTLLSNGGTVGLVAFNPVTGAVSAVQTITTTSADTFHTITKINATTVGVFWGQTAATAATARVAGKLFSIASDLTFTAGTTALLPLTTVAMGDINALVLSGGGIAISVRVTASNQGWISGFGVSGLTLTPGNAPSSFSQAVQYTISYAPQMTEVGPNYFALAVNPASAAASYIVTYSINASTGVVAFVQSQSFTQGAAYATPGQGSVMPLSGTTKYVCVWGQDSGNYTNYFSAMVNITTAGAISVINGQTNLQGTALYAPGAGANRIAWQSFGGATPSVVIPGSGTSGAMWPGYMRLYESGATAGLPLTQTLTGGGSVGTEVSSPAPGVWLYQLSSSLCRFTYDGTSTTDTSWNFSSLTGTLTYGAIVNGVPVVYFSNGQVATYRANPTRICKITQSLQTQSGIYANGNNVIGLENGVARMRVYEVAQ